MTICKDISPDFYTFILNIGQIYFCSSVYTHYRIVPNKGVPIQNYFMMQMTTCPKKFESQCPKNCNINGTLFFSFSDLKRRWLSNRVTAKEVTFDFPQWCAIVRNSMTQTTHKQHLPYQARPNFKSLSLRIFKTSKTSSHILGVPWDHVTFNTDNSTSANIWNVQQVGGNQTLTLSQVSSHVPSF